MGGSGRWRSKVGGRRGILHSACNIDILNKRAASPEVKLPQRKEEPIENASATKTCPLGDWLYFDGETEQTVGT